MGGGSRGVKKEKLRHLSTRQTTAEEARAVNHALLAAGSPIAVAILGAVLVEHDLERVIRRRLSIRDDEDWEALLDERGPLSTFHRKIEMAYVLKIIDKPTRRNMDIIRAIRNAFAHSKRTIGFDNPLIAAELAKAQPMSRRKRAFRLLNRISDPKTKYTVLCWQTAGPLNQRLTRSIMSVTRRKMRQSLKRAPESSFLSQLLLGGLGSPLSHPQSTQQSRSDDPKTPRVRGLLSSLLEEKLAKKAEDE
jgi:hypothetical protein